MDYQNAYEVFIWCHLITHLNIHSIIKLVLTLALFITDHVWLVGRVCYDLLAFVSRSQMLAAFSVQREATRLSPSLSRLVKGCHHNKITHLLHPHSQPVRLPSPTLSISAPLFLPHSYRPHPSTILISTRLLWLTHLTSFGSVVLSHFCPCRWVSAAALGRNKGWRQRWREDGEVQAKVL